MKVKRLAAKSTNTLVSQVQFFQMGQDRGVLARLQGALSRCNFTVRCTSCSKTTS